MLKCINGESHALHQNNIIVMICIFCLHIYYVNVIKRLDQTLVYEDRVINNF